MADATGEEIQPEFPAFPLLDSVLSLNFTNVRVIPARGWGEPEHVPQPVLRGQQGSEGTRESGPLRAPRYERDHNGFPFSRHVVATFSN